MTAWLKAGLIGAGILIALDLLSLIPNFICVSIPLNLFAYLLIGAMAASYMPPMREVGSAAGQGALAALIASVTGGLVAIIIAVLRASMGGMTQALDQLPPGLRQQLIDSNLPPNLVFGPAGAAAGGAICCSVGVLFAVALGAVGGVIYASSKPK